MFARRVILFGIGFVLCLCTVVTAERTLDRNEILDIFDELTSQPAETWISAGTIKAVHDEYRAAKTTDQAKINNQINLEIEEYRNNEEKAELTEELQKMKLDAIPFNVRYELSNEYSMSSDVVLKYDGERFSWEISVNSRTDSVIPGKELEGNYMTEQFNRNWNDERVFTWDGQKYTIYSSSGNQAVEDITGDFPHVVNGPLTAGIIPWGTDNLTYESLSSAEASAVEVDISNRKEIHLTINSKDGTETLFVLEPERDYAVLSCLIKGQDSIVARQYNDFRLVSGNWVPMTILVETYDDLADKPFASDLWKFTSISSDIPSPDSFNVNYNSDTIITYRFSERETPLMYQYTDAVEIKQLLEKRIAFLSGNTASQNCATAALNYAAGQLKKDIINKQGAELTAGPNKKTSIYEMKQFAQNLGLHCRVIKTDLETLKNQPGSMAILHIPGKSHFVLLDHIDRNYVWFLDLASRELFCRVDIDRFSKDWADGTVILIADKPVELNGSFVEIADAQLHNFIGAGGYQCTQLIQEYDVIYCIYIAYQCAGYYQVYLLRYGCEPAESGTCTYKSYVRKLKTLCINDDYTGYCNVTGEWIYYFMDACK